MDEVVDIMKTNVEKVLERDQKLSELDDRAGKIHIIIIILRSLFTIFLRFFSSELVKYQFENFPRLRFFQLLSTISS